MTYVPPPTYEELAAYLAVAADALRAILTEAVANGGGELRLAEPSWAWAGGLAAETLDAIGLEP